MARFSDTRLDANVTYRMMGGSSVVTRQLIAFAALAAFGCGESSRERKRDGAGEGGSGGVNAGGTGAAPAGSGGQSGSAGAGTAGSAGTGAICDAGAARCTNGLRETCTVERAWRKADFVCAANVAVDDELGTYCVTKTNGTYRCFGREAVGELPPDHYVRVQLTGYGDNDGSPGLPLPIIGLTEDGRLVSEGFVLPPDLAPVVAFRATNMFGYPSVCPLFSDGTFVSIDNVGSDFGRVLTYDGRFTRAFCVFEGLTAGVRTDGSLWSNYLDATSPTPGNDWLEVAHSVGILCGIKTSGEIACRESLACSSRDQSGCGTYEPPVFPPGRYRAIAATGGSVCALDEQGVLLCKRFDDADMPVAAGPYTFIDGGKDLLCAIRTDGSTACFRHGGEGWPENVGDFAPIEPAVDPGW